MIMAKIPMIMKDNKDILVDSRLCSSRACRTSCSTVNPSKEEISNSILDKESKVKNITERFCILASWDFE